MCQLAVSDHKSGSASGTSLRGQGIRDEEKCGKEYGRRVGGMKDDALCFSDSIVTIGLVLLV